MDTLNVRAPEQIDSVGDTVKFMIYNTPDPRLDYQFGTFHTGRGRNI